MKIKKNLSDRQASVDLRCEKYSNEQLIQFIVKRDGTDCELSVNDRGSILQIIGLSYGIEGHGSRFTSNMVKLWLNLMEMFENEKFQGYKNEKLK